MQLGRRSLQSVQHHININANETARHAADFGNAVSDNNGNLAVLFEDRVSQLYEARGILGRTVVLHALADDLSLGNNTASLANGNAGVRIACGVIGTSQ